MWERLLRWAVGLFVGAIPVGLNLAIVGLTPLPLTLTAVLGKGELLMLSVGLSVGAILDLALSRRGSPGAKTGGIVFCALNAISATGVFAVAGTAQAFGVEVAGFWLAVVSLPLYILSVLVSGGCVTVLKESGRCSAQQDTSP
jgi:hypothetical protein